MSFQLFFMKTLAEVEAVNSCNVLLVVYQCLLNSMAVFQLNTKSGK